MGVGSLEIGLPSAEPVSRRAVVALDLKHDVTRPGIVEPDRPGACRGGRIARRDGLRRGKRQKDHRTAPGLTRPIVKTTDQTPPPKDVARPVGRDRRRSDVGPVGQRQADGQGRAVTCFARGQVADLDIAGRSVLRLQAQRDRPLPTCGRRQPRDVPSLVIVAIGEHDMHL